MNKLHYLAVIIVSIAIGACTTKQLYNELQHNQKLECEKLPPSQYDECMQEASDSYEEYKREREDILNNPKRGAEARSPSLPSQLT